MRAFLTKIEIAVKMDAIRCIFEWLLLTMVIELNGLQFGLKSNA